MNILVYEGVFQYNVVNYFAKELAEGFKGLGHKVILYNLSQQGRIEDFIEILLKENIELIISFNGIQAARIDIIKELIGKLNIVMGIILVDHPFDHWQRIQWEKGENTFICMYDEGYLHIVEDYIDDQIPIAKLHHAGIGSSVEQNEKIYDVVMAGTIQESSEEIPEGILKEIGDELYNKAIQNYSIPLDYLLDEVMKNRGLSKALFRENQDFQEALAYMYNLTDRQIRNTMRVKVLEAMLKAGIKVDLFGNCKIEQLKHFDNLTYHGSIDYLDLLHEIKKAKILVNDFKTVTNGSHERILSTMLNKTLVLSNQNTYCNNDYIQGRHIVYYDVNSLETLTDQVKYYLEHDDEREKIVHEAYVLTSEKHTWKNRASELESIYYSFKEIKDSINVSSK